MAGAASPCLKVMGATVRNLATRAYAPVSSDFVRHVRFSAALAVNAAQPTAHSSASGCPPSHGRITPRATSLKEGRTR